MHAILPIFPKGTENNSSASVILYTQFVVIAYSTNAIQFNIQHMQ